MILIIPRGSSSTRTAASCQMECDVIPSDLPLVGTHLQTDCEATLHRSASRRARSIFLAHNQTPQYGALDDFRVLWQSQW